MVAVIKQRYASPLDITGCAYPFGRNLLASTHVNFQTGPWSESNPGGITYENGGLTAVCLTGGTDTRPYMAVTSGPTLTIGQDYVFGADFEYISGAATKAFVQGDTVNLRHNAGGRLALYFNTASATPIMRLGLGISSAEALGVSYKIRNPFLYKLTPYTVPTDYSAPGTIEYFGKTNANTLATVTSGATGRQVTHVAGVDVSGYKPNVLTVIGCGDSFSNDSTEYPYQLAQQLNGVQIFWNGVAGRTLVTMATEGDDTFALTGEVFNSESIRNAVAVIQGGANDALGADTAPDEAPAIAAASAAVISLINSAKKASINRIVLFTISPSDNMNASNENVRVAHNAWVRQYADANGYGLCDIDYILKDPSTPTHLLLAYDSGDGLHPNTAGEIAIAQELRAVIHGTGTKVGTGLYISPVPGLYMPF